MHYFTDNNLSTLKRHPAEYVLRLRLAELSYGIRLQTCGGDMLTKIQGSEGEEKAGDAAAGGTGATLTSKLFLNLRRDIVSGQLKPGSKIKTKALCDRFGVGLSPVREALNRLASQGLITQTDRRGFSVMSVSEEELADVTDMRIWVEGTALERSIDKGTEKWEEEVLVAFHRLIRTPRFVLSSNTDSDEWIEAHKSFHMSLLSACGSAWMMQIAARIFEASERYRHLGGLAAGARDSAQEEHRSIMQATIDHDKRNALELLTSHYRKTQLHLKEVIERFRVD
jgi:GntR family carbon starvation induced transcriptional regulator